MMNVIITCPFCGKESVINMTFEEYMQYDMGKLTIQEIFPGMEASDREILISGMCKECQKEIFS